MKHWQTHWSEIAGRLRRAPRLFVGLDYDGVLAPLQDHADQATLSAPLKRLLRQMSDDSKFQLAVVSGRALRDLRKKVPFPGIILAGNHGMDIQFRGKRERHGDGAGYQSALRQAKRHLAGLVQRFPGTYVEDKRLGLGVHYRAIRADRRTPLLNAFNASRKQLPASLAVLYQKFVFDVIPDVSWDKGEAVRRIWDHIGRDALPIYVGDDQTDESAFRALRRRGITVFVGNSRLSHAEYYIPSCQGVPPFLQRLRALFC